MMAMTITSLLLALTFVAFAAWRLDGLPESISATVWALPRGGWRWLWTVWLWAVALLTLIPAIEILSRVDMEALGFGTLACLMFCGSMPLFDRDNLKWHWITGIAGCILSQLCVAIISPWWLVAWALWTFLMGSTVIQPSDGDMRKLFKGKGVFVAEMICFITVIGALLTCR